MIDIDVKVVLSPYQFIPLNAFKGDFTDKSTIIAEKFIMPKINKFFEVINQSIEKFDYFSYEDVFSDVEFMNKQFNCNGKSFVQYYIYERLMVDVTKSVNDKVNFKPKYCITFDKDLTPTFAEGSTYGYMSLGKKPILYFIFIDFQEFLHFLKKFNK